MSPTSKDGTWLLPGEYLMSQALRGPVRDRKHQLWEPGKRGDVLARGAMPGSGVSRTGVGISKTQEIAMFICASVGDWDSGARDHIRVPLYLSSGGELEGADMLAQPENSWMLSSNDIPTAPRGEGWGSDHHMVTSCCHCLRVCMPLASCGVMRWQGKMGLLSIVSL